MMILAAFFMQRVSTEDEHQNHQRNQLIVAEMQRLGVTIPAPNAYTQQASPTFIQKQTEQFKSIAGESSSKVKTTQVTLEASSMSQNRDGVFHRIWIWIVRQWNQLLSFFHSKNKEYKKIFKFIINQRNIIWKNKYIEIILYKYNF